jgi:hypothetical protein
MTRIASHASNKFQRVSEKLFERKVILEKEVINRSSDSILIVVQECFV